MKNRPVSRRRLLAFLRDPRSYPKGTRRVQVVQTHISWVVLTANRVYKVKKPVNFGFLDFSSIEKRRHFCEREVVLNRRLCPDIYLGVVPISMKEDRLVFGLGDRIVDYAVEMNRLPAQFFMPRRIRRGDVATGDVDAIVGVLRPFYEAQASRPEIAMWGRIGNLRLSTDENFRQSWDFMGVTISCAAFTAIRIYARSFYRPHAALFDARVREGRILDCHGDLHLDHIHLAPERISIYDCIEFNDRLRYIDVANDVAFLAMDLDFHGRPDLSRHLAAQMAKELADPGLLRLLDFYKCYRAFVRGKVESFQNVAAARGEERRECRARAERYFRLALQYAVSGSKPMVLIVMGRVGTGKSVLADSLGRELDWPVLSSDRIRKKLAGVPLEVRGGERERRRLYSSRMSDKTYAALARGAVKHSQDRCGVILDATFSSRDRREQLRRVLELSAIAYCFIEIRLPTPTIRNRLKKRMRSAGEISDARLDDFPLLDRAYEPPTELDPRHFFAVKNVSPPETVVVAALKTLTTRRARDIQDPG